MTTRFYSLCQFVQWGTFNGQYGRHPKSLVHAKEVGTSLAACGIEAGTWQRLWEVPFGSATSEHCAQCVEAVRAR